MDISYIEDEYMMLVKYRIVCNRLMNRWKWNINCGQSDWYIIRSLLKNIIILFHHDQSIT